MVKNGPWVSGAPAEKMPYPFIVYVICGTCIITRQFSKCGAGCCVIVDLHCHSFWSADSDSRPDQLVARAIDAEIGILSISDHNFLSPTTDALQKQFKGTIKLIAGCEISCQSPWSQEEEIHILAYFPREQEGSSAVTDLLALVRSVLHDRNRGICLEAGLDVEMVQGIANVSAQPSGPLSPGMAEAYMFPLYLRQLPPTLKPGIRAQAGEALCRLCAAGSLMRLPAPEEVLEVVACSGGYSSLAHPTRYGAQRPDLAKFVTKLAGTGHLHALEAMYGPRPQDCREMQALAEDLGLRLSGGSDSHDGSASSRDMLEQLSAAGSTSSNCTILTLFEDGP